MQPDPPLADFAVVRRNPDGQATIYACRAHLNHTKTVLQSGNPAALITVSPANVDPDGNLFDVPRHGCKGHMEGWPVTAG